MFMTVVRLYYDHDMDSNKAKSSKNYTKMRGEYEYARDRLKIYAKTNPKFALDEDPEEVQLDPRRLSYWWPPSGFTIFFGIIMSAIIYDYYYSGKNRSSGIFGLEESENEFEFKQADQITERLDDVKGIDEIKDEIINVIRMIRDPSAYTSKGAKMHKGVLLYGNPGTGKTMLSRAIAGEAGVSFLYCTGSSFDEMFVGVGAKRIR